MRTLIAVFLSCLCVGYTSWSRAGPALPDTDPGDTARLWEVYIENALRQQLAGREFTVTVRRVYVVWSGEPVLLSACVEAEQACDLEFSVQFLRQLRSPAELAVVLGHEVGHIATESVLWQETRMYDAIFTEREAAADLYGALSVPQGACHLSAVLRRIALMKQAEMPPPSPFVFASFGERLKRLDRICAVQRLLGYTDRATPQPRGFFFSLRAKRSIDRKQTGR